MISGLDQSFILPIIAGVLIVVLIAIYGIRTLLSHKQIEFDASLLSRFRTAIPDVNMRDRLMNAERRKNPQKSESELIKSVLESYYKDRR